MDDIKKCSNCNENKKINEFHKRKDTYIGYRAECKVCRSIKGLTYSKKHRKEKIEYARRYRLKNIEILREKDKKRLPFRKKQNKAKRKEYYEKNKIKILSRARKRYKESPRMKISQSVNSIINRKIRKGLLEESDENMFYFLQYTVDDLVLHLENKFEIWMDWDNYGVGKEKWNIDHEIPESSFKYKTMRDKEFKKCWALDNLCPFDSIENIKKGNKLNYEK